MSEFEPLSLRIT